MKLFISKLHYKKKLKIYERLVILILRLFSLFYHLVVLIRNKLYDNKIIPSFRTTAFVLSVGNITTGGVGKTPFTLAAAQYYLGRNKRVAIISRGYGAKLDNSKPNLISDGSGPLFPTAMTGDEPAWLASYAKGAYVVTCHSRIKAVNFVMEKYNPEIIILDDAFQHRKMQRDLDIVLVDAKNKFGNNYLLPAGPLREDLSSIKRADKIVVVNKGHDSKDSLKYCDYLKKKYKKDTFLCNLVPDDVYNVKTGEILEKQKRVMAFSAIGQPESFYDFLKDDYKLVAILDFEDHHYYDMEDVSKIIHYAQEENVDSIVTTEKDIIKLIDLIRDVELPVKFYALRLKAYVDIKDVCGV